MASEEGGTGRSAAWGVAAGLFGTSAIAVWQVATAPKSTIPILPVYVFGGITLAALYMCFATIWGWWPTGRSVTRSSEDPARLPLAKHAADSPRRPRRLWLVAVACLVIAGVVCVPLLFDNSTVSGSGHGTRLATSNRSDTLPVKFMSVYPEPSTSAYNMAFPQRLHLTTSDISNLENISAYQAYAAWMIDHSGAPTTEVDLAITIENTAPHPVEIVGAEVIRQCQAPLSGTLVYNPSQGAPPNLTMGFNLDNQYPFAQDWTISGMLSGNYFAERTIALTPRETETILVGAETTRYFCQFTLLFQIDDGSNHVVEPVPDDGHPFAVTASLQEGDLPHEFARYRALYVGGTSSPTGGLIAEDPATAEPSDGHISS